MKADECMGSLKDFNKFTNAVISAYEMCYQQVPLLDQEIQDILHDIELSEGKTRTESARIYREIRRIRQERRNYKNEATYLKPIYEWCITNRHVGSELAKVQGQIRKIVETQERRIYTPRKQND